jgi:hypothetical protein
MATTFLVEGLAFSIGILFLIWRMLLAIEILCLIMRLFMKKPEWPTTVGIFCLFCLDCDIRSLFSRLQIQWNFEDHSKLV